MRPHRDRMYPRTHNRPYCLAIAFQPSTVYGLARLLVLHYGRVSPLYSVGVHILSRAGETMYGHVISRVGAQQARKEEARGETVHAEVPSVPPFVYLHNCGLAQFSCQFFQLIFHGILSQNYTAPPTTGRLDYLIMDDDNDGDTARSAKLILSLAVCGIESRCKYPTPEFNTFFF